MTGIWQRTEVRRIIQTGDTGICYNRTVYGKRDYAED